MIIGKIHPGSGIGDQLFSYITTRTIALDKGYEFGFVGTEFFKGKDFMNLDWGKEPNVAYTIEQPAGKLQIVNLIDVGTISYNKLWEAPTYYDPNVNFIEDGTIIDGCSAQDEKYWGHRLNEIREWLKVEPLEVLDKTWIVNIRGGEYRSVPELILPKEYWQEATKGKFIDVHTDDVEYAKELLGQDISVLKDISLNWRALRYAKNAVISNSAFAIIPRLLSEGETIAPRYWAGRNVGEWRRPQNYYSKFLYI